MKPWINDSLKQLIERKYYWYFKLKKVGTLQVVNIVAEKKLKIEYNFWKKSYNKLNKKLKMDFFNKKFEDNVDNCRGTWTAIKNVIYDGNPPAKEKIKLKNTNGDFITNNKEVADVFNDYFISAGELLTKNVVDSPFDITSEIKGKNLFSLRPTTPMEVNIVIQNLRNTESTGLDGIKTKAVKLCAEYISETLSELINASFKSGVFPDLLKISRVFPIFKSGTKSDKNNYRPISINSVFTKIFEMIFKARLMEFLRQEDILCSEQYGFRPNSNTQMALFDLITEIQGNRHPTNS